MSRFAQAGFIDDNGRPTIGVVSPEELTVEGIINTHANSTFSIIDNGGITFSITVYSNLSTTTYTFKYEPGKIAGAIQFNDGHVELRGNQRPVRSTSVDV